MIVMDQKDLMKGKNYLINFFFKIKCSFVQLSPWHSFDFSLIYSNKENEPLSLNGTAPPRRRRTMNPYSQPLPFNQNERNARRNSVMTAKPIIIVTTGTSKASTAQIDEESPTVKRILKAKGCSSVEELLARDQQKANATSGAKAPATNISTSTTARNRYKSTTNGSKDATNGSKTAATNQSKSTTNGDKNRVKSTNGSKTTNPKKKSKSKCFY